MILITVFAWEFLIMVLFAKLRLPAHWSVTYLLDAALLSLLVAPALYLFYLGPTRKLAACQRRG